MLEKRTAARIDLRLDAHLTVEGETVTAQLGNLSLGGACAYAPHFFSSGTSVTVVLAMPAGPMSRLVLRGRTIYSFQSAPGVFRTGIRFEALTEASRDLVSAIMQGARPA